MNLKEFRFFVRIELTVSMSKGYCNLRTRSSAALFLFQDALNYNFSYKFCLRQRKFKTNFV